ncbi:ATP-binding protein [Hankyongella ginsenosidimutans]|nr:ATP-binding protein [Hankyongella ginsenosidimutans]
MELRLGQVLRNLIDNALSFSPDGGTVRVTLEPSGGDSWQMSVDDDGPGIPAENMADIFKRFYSQRPVDETFGQHSGLGLAIAKQIVEGHGGAILAQNRAEGGGISGARLIVRLRRDA